MASETEGDEEDSNAQESPVEEIAGLPPADVGKRAANELDAGFQLTRAAPLDPGSASALMRSRDTRIVLLAGPVASGKTTLIASLYELFQSGSVGSYLFAGSLTLHAFEERCHHARVTSERDSAETPRTPFSPSAHFLHFRMANAETPLCHQDVLFADLSGEAFAQIRDSAEECQQFQLLRRADRVVMLVDGERMCEPRFRHTATDEIGIMLRRCLELGMLGRRSLVDIVLTKFDFVEASPQSKDAKMHWASQQTRWRSRHADGLGRLRFFEAAARPVPGSKLANGFGLADALADWITETRGTQSYLELSDRVPGLTRYYQRYGVANSR